MFFHHFSYGQCVLYRINVYKSTEKYMFCMCVCLSLDLFKCVTIQSVCLICLYSSFSVVQFYVFKSIVCECVSVCVMCTILGTKRVKCLLYLAVYFVLCSVNSIAMYYCNFVTVYVNRLLFLYICICCMVVYV